MIRRTRPGLSLLLLAAGCSSGTGPEATLWEATLAPVAPATVSGVAAAVAQARLTRVSVEIREAVAGESYGWRLAKGTCAAEGVVVGGLALYPALTPGVSRVAGAEAVVPGQLDPGGAHAVRIVHAGATGASQVVACGALVETS